MNTKKSPTNTVIIIPTYTNTGGLQEALRCNKKQGDYPVVIVNNNPQNNLTDLPEHDPSDILTEKKNRGFAKACNDGAWEAVARYKPKYLVFLNDDVTFTKDWIKMCIAEMGKKKWTATTPVLMHPDGTIENVGYKILKEGKIRLLTALTGGGRPHGITAAALVIDAQIFQEIDGFDESFFAYLEDVDLCLRLTEIGKTFGVTTDASVTHLGQQTSSKMSIKKAYLDFKNWIKLIDRHWSQEEKRKYLASILKERLRNLSGMIKSVSG